MLEVGQIIEVSIIDINHEGKGVARVHDFVVFIEGTITGDLVKIKISQKKKNYAIGELIKIVERSQNRIDPPCEFYFKCGGCQLMHMDYKEQLIYKKDGVINEFRRASVNIKDAIINDTIGMEEPYRYRNKTAFSVTNKNNKICIGPYEEKTYNTVDITGCMLQSKQADEIIKLFKTIMLKHSIEPYDKKTGRGIVRNLVIRSNKLNELMLIIVTNTEKFPDKNIIVKELISNIKEIKTVVQNINSSYTNLVMGNKNVVLFGEGTIKDTIGDLIFTISPNTFFQINSIQTEKLYKTAIEYTNLDKNDICIDLYCGIGTISLMAAKHSKKVYGVEIVEQSIVNARENAKVNSINNTEFLTGKAEKVLPMLYNKSIIADTIILDPPRKGCEKDVIDTIINMAPKKVVYVSCNPSTLARDVKLLEDGNYKLVNVQPVDQFPWTTHVETVVLLYNKKEDVINVEIEMQI
jgi:23S rRNA (uracil1939-C5)-methyltransferase